MSVHYDCDGLKLLIPSISSPDVPCQGRGAVQVVLIAGTNRLVARQDLCRHCAADLTRRIVDGHWRDGRSWTFTDLRRPDEVEDLASGDTTIVKEP